MDMDFDGPAVDHSAAWSVATASADRRLLIQWYGSSACLPISNGIHRYFVVELFAGRVP